MSSFVTGLVRRGAGLAPPVTIRPAVGPQNLPVALESSDASPLLSPASPPNENAQAAEIDSTRRGVQPALPTVDFRPEEPEAQPQPAIGSRVSIRKEVRFMPRSNPDDVGPTHVEQVTTPSLLPPSPRGNTTNPSPTDRGSDSTVRARQRPGNSDNLQESATLAVPVRKASAAAPTTCRGAASEPRNIQVKIGKVEIRSSQPAAPARATAKQTTGGFADLKLARVHLDRGAW